MAALSAPGNRDHLAARTGQLWKARRRYPNLPYRVAGGDVALIIALLIGIIVAIIPFFVKAGLLPPVVG